MQSRIQSLVTASSALKGANLADALNEAKLTAQNFTNEIKNLNKEVNFSFSELSQIFGSFYNSFSSQLSNDQISLLFDDIVKAAQVSGASISDVEQTIKDLGRGILNTTTQMGKFPFQIRNIFHLIFYHF